MKNSIEHFLKKRFPHGADLGPLADALVEYICTPEFTALYAQRCISDSSSELRIFFNQWRTTMTDFTAAMTKLGQQIAAANSPATAAHLQAIDDHLTNLDTKEGANEAADAETKAGLQALLDGANEAAPGAPAPAPAPAPAA